MEDTQTVSTNPEEQDPKASVKTRLANLLINRVALSECLNVIRDACVQRAGEIIEDADEEAMGKILQDLESFENPPKQEDSADSPSSPEAPAPEGSSGPELTPVDV